MAVNDWSTQYPTALDTTTQMPTLTNNSDVVRVSQPHAVRDAIIQLETQVGATTPAAGSLRQRVTTLEGATTGSNRWLAFSDDTEFTEAGTSFVTKKTFRIIADSNLAIASWRVVASIWRDGGAGTVELHVTVGSDTFGADLTSSSASEAVVSGNITKTASNDTPLTVNIQIRCQGGATLAHLRYTDIYARV